MRRRLQKIYWLGVTVTIVMSLVAMAFMLVLRVSDKRENLHDILEAAAAWTAESDESLQEMADNIAAVSPPIRVTFLMEHGLVLADSERAALSMDNHYDRPEVIEARQGGVIGESLRLSDTRSAFELYAAEEIAPHLILRLSYPVNEITEMIATYSIGISVLFFVLFVIQRRAFTRFSRQLIQQMEDVRRVLEGQTEACGVVFPELQPAIRHITYLAQRLQQDLEEVNRTARLRTDFVANASHEIRSPLTSIMGFAEMLDEGLADTPEEKEMCIRTIRSECERMLEVVGDILLLSRAEKQEAVEKTSVDLRAIAQEVCQSLSPQAAQKDIALHVEGSMTCMAQEKDVWEILHNLTDNAIRYGRVGGWVKILMDSDTLTVEDNGVGVSREHLPHLFEQFYRVDQSRDSDARGTGLGLSIVRTLVQRNGGAIAVESTLGEGSRFIVRFGGEGGQE